MIGLFFTWMAFMSASFSGDYMVMYWLICAFGFHLWSYLNAPSN